MSDYHRNIDFFEEVMGEYVPPEMIPWLKQNGFFIAPASANHHGANPCGLIEHSIAVTETLVWMTKQNALHWQRQESPYLIGMFHDLCKIGQYEYDGSQWQYRNDIMLKGHGDKSVMLLCQFMRLTEEEVMCIRYHMGAFTDKAEWEFYSRAVKRFPNVLWTHAADMLESQTTGRWGG